MSKAIVDPEELIRFANNLKAFNERLKEKSVILNGQFKQLGNTWQDDQHQKFAEEYKTTMKAIALFLKNSEEEHIPFLLRKAHRAKEYQNQR